MEPNVILIVLDTLREDHSGKLLDLERLGFMRYQNAIATSSWTLPSHVSLFTGQMPSKHAIHESRTISVDNTFQLRDRNLQVQKSGILFKLRKRGYSTIGLSCNPHISPAIGFPFENYKLFGPQGEITHAGKYYSEQNEFVRMIKMLMDLKLPLLLGEIEQHPQTMRLFKRHTLEKGSIDCVRAFGSLKLEQPFFLFVNFMEAHEPYSWDDNFRWPEIRYKYATSTPLVLKWRERYPIHADLAISRLFMLLSLLKPWLGNSMVVVISDHGQLLGEGKRYGHGLFLEDELLRVPLYVKFPAGVQPIKQDRPFVSLSDIPLLIESTIYNIRMKFGSDFALAESFGPEQDLQRLGVDQERIGKLYEHNIRIFTPAGTGTFNQSTQSIFNLTQAKARPGVEKIGIEFTHR